MTPLIQANQRIIRFGIIGTGRIAGDFASDLKLVPNVALQAVLSRNRASAETFKAANGSVQAYDSIDEFMVDPNVDVVYIASPNTAHVAQALRAIRAKKAVLIEKPMASSEPEAQVIGREALKYGVLAMEAMWIRFLPGILKAKALVQAGAIGDLIRVNGQLSYKKQYDTESRMFNKSLGGGASLDLGVYLLSLTTFLFGEPSSISGSWEAASSGVDLEAIYSLIYPHFQAQLSSSFAKDGGNVFEVEGTTGILRIEDPFIKGQTIRILRGRAAKSGLTRPSFDSPMNLFQKLAARLPVPGQKVWRFPYPGHGLQFEAAAMAEMVRNGATHSSVVPLGDSASVLRMIGLVLSRPSTND